MASVFILFICLLLLISIPSSSPQHHHQQHHQPWWSHISDYHHLDTQSIPPPPVYNSNSNSNDDEYTQSRATLVYEGLMRMVCVKLDAALNDNNNNNNNDNPHEPKPPPPTTAGEVWMMERSERIVAMTLSFHETQAWRQAQRTQLREDPKGEEMSKELLRMWLYRKLCDHRRRPGDKDDMSLEATVAVGDTAGGVSLDDVIAQVIHRSKQQQQQQQQQHETATTPSSSPLIVEGERITQPQRRRISGEILLGDVTRSARHYRFIEWLQANNFTDFGRVSLRAHRDYGLGMVATAANVRRDDLLFAVPRSIFLSTSNPQLRPLTKKLLELARAHFEQHPPANFNTKYASLLWLSITIMCERRLNDSFWQPYLRVLPEPLSPAFYGSEAVNALRNRWVADMRFSVLNHTVRLFNTLIHGSTPFKLHLYSLYPPATSTATTTPRVPNMSAQRMHQVVLMAEFLWATVSVLQRSHDWGGGDRVMIPFLDFINHNSALRVGQTAYYFNTHDDKRPRRILTNNIAQRDTIDSIYLNALHDATEGQQVYTAYHNRVNSVTLFLQYGFVTAHHAMDFVTLHHEPPDDNDAGNRTATLVDIWAQLRVMPRVHVTRSGIIDGAYLRAMIVGMLDDDELRAVSNAFAVENTMNTDACVLWNITRHIHAYQRIDERVQEWCDVDAEFARTLENAELALQSHHVWNETHSVDVARKLNMLNALRFRRQCHQMVSIVRRHIGDRLHLLRTFAHDDDDDDNDGRRYELAEGERDITTLDCAWQRSAGLRRLFRVEAPVDGEYSFVRQLHFFHTRATLDFRVSPKDDSTDYLLLWPFFVANTY